MDSDGASNFGEHHVGVRATDETVQIAGAGDILTAFHNHQEAGAYRVLLSAESHTG